MNVLVRDIDPIAIKKIDEMAKKKSITRQSYMKALIEKAAYEREDSETQMRMEVVISQNTLAMEKVANQLNEFGKVIEELTEDESDWSEV